MPTPTALHAVVFGAGAAVGMLGAGIWSRQREQAHAPTPVNMVPSMPTTPVATIPGATAMALTPSDVLRFGNPGA